MWSLTGESSISSSVSFPSKALSLLLYIEMWIGGCSGLSGGGGGGPGSGSPSGGSNFASGSSEV